MAMAYPADHHFLFMIFKRDKEENPLPKNVAIRILEEIKKRITSFNGGRS